jgi:hypothetical protein
MSTDKGRAIGVHLEGGYVQRITSNDPALDGATFVVYDDGNVQKALFSCEADATLQVDAEAAVDSTRCHGIGMACDLAGERLLALGTKKFTDTREAVDDVVSVIEELREMIGAALRLRGIKPDDDSE